jgi:nucleoside-diphosphate-sugar epimerase
MKISILGCGWLGLPLGKHLVEQGYQVKGSTTSETKTFALTSAGIHPFLLNLSPAITGEKISEFFDAETLIIAIPPRASKFGEDFHVQQIHSLIPFLEQSSISNIIYISSTSVYPELNRVVIEQDETIETSGLVQAEKILQSFSKTIKTTLLRCGGLMGYERIPAKYFAGKTINTGQIPVNYVHRDDVIGIIESIILQKKFGAIFNIVSPQHPVREDVYLKNCTDLGFKKPIFENPTEAIPFKIISPEKLLNEIKYTFKFPDPLGFYYLLVPIRFEEKNLRT